MNDGNRGYVKPEISTQVRDGRYFYLRHGRKADPCLVVVCGGRENCAPDYEINPPTFPYFGIEWVERGRGGLWLRGRHHELEPGAVFCYGPGIPCRIQTDARQPLTKYFVDITGPDAQGLLRQAGLPPGQCLQVLGIMELAELFEGMHRESTRHGAQATEIVAAYLRLLLLKIKARKVPGRSLKSQSGTLRRETFLRCRQFLQDHFRRYPTIEEAALALELTPSYLCRLFREHGELSPYQFLLRVRMNHALDRLLLSGGRVKQAFYESGFTDPAHFSRVFKQIHGLPPRELAARTLRATRAKPE